MFKFAKIINLSSLNNVSPLRKNLSIEDPNQIMGRIINADRLHPPSPPSSPPAITSPTHTHTKSSITGQHLYT